jgi:putative endonuclease
MTTVETGGRAESAASQALARRHGYKIVARNYRIRAGEIDIIAFDGEVLCFVEVRSRGREDFGLPEETISATKRRRIARAAQSWLTRYTREPICRFDVVAISGDEIRVIKDAFRLE